jgi:hypothetical protein
MTPGLDAYAVVTVATFAAVAVVIVLHYEGLLALGRHHARRHRRGESLRNRRSVLKVMAGLFVLHVAEIWIFGLTYWGLLHWPGAGELRGAAPHNLLECVYLSAVTFTTVGFGDLAPVGPIRFLAGTEALTGFMLITWSASFTYLQMERHWTDGGR